MSRQTRNSRKTSELEEHENLNDTIIETTPTNVELPLDASTPSAASVLNSGAEGSQESQTNNFNSNVFGIHLQGIVQNTYRKNPGAKVRERWITNPNHSLIPGRNPLQPEVPLTPSSFSGRRSPRSDIETEDAQSIDLNISNTPYGAGVNHHLTGRSAHRHILPGNPSTNDIDEFIGHLREEIENYGSDYMSNVGWIDKFEKHSAELFSQLSNVSEICMNGQYLDQLEQSYLLTSELENHTKRLRSFAEADKQKQGSPFLLRESLLQPNSTVGNIPDRRKSSTTDLLSSDEDPNRTLNSRNSFPQLIRNLNLKVKKLEMGTAKISEIDKNLRTLIASKAKNQDLSNLCIRITNIEEKMRQVQETQTLHKLNAIAEKVETNSRSCIQNQVLAKGFCVENSRLRKNVAELIAKVKNLEAENATLSAYQLSLQNWFDLQDPLEEDMQYYQAPEIGALIDLVDNPHPSEPVESEEVMAQSSEMRGSSYVDQAITGIYRIPTPSVTTLLNTQGVASFSTTTVMSNHNHGSLHHGRSCESYDNPNAVPITCNANGMGIQPHISLIPQNIQNAAQNVVRQPTVQVSSAILPNPSRVGFQNILNNNRVEMRPQVSFNKPTGRGVNSNSRGEESFSPNSSVDTSKDGESRLGKRLKRAGKNLQLMLKPPVDDSLTKAIVQSIHTSLLPAVDAERKEVSHLIEKYESGKSGPPDYDLLDEMEDIVQEAKIWSRGMREKHRELDCSKKPLDKKFYEDLKRFSENSEVNIFEFLKKFEAYTEEQGSAKERATLLFEHYLHENVQMELHEMRENYTEMRKWLIERFGDVKVITDNILKKLAKETIPDDASSSVAVTNYYRKLNSVLIKIKELNKTVNMPAEELNAHIYSSEFISKLLGFVPQRAKFAFRQELMSENEDYRRVRGAKSFSILAATIFKRFELNDSSTKDDTAASLSKIPRSYKPEKTISPRIKKTVHSIDVEYQGTSEDESHSVSAHFQKKSPTQKGKQDKTQDSEKKFKYPCCLKNHTHELGECQEFFAKSPTARKQLAMRQNCFTCLGSFEGCKGGCKNKVPSDLLCIECKSWADQNGKSASNILFCKRNDHTKPDDKTLTGMLKKYLVNFNPTKVQGPIKLAAHLYMAAHLEKCSKCTTRDCKCKPKTVTKQNDPSVETPAINTYSGEDVKVSESQTIPESDHESVYVMQLLNLRGRDVLAFFDRGANQHLIDGELAEDISLKAVSDESVSIGVVGGGKIWTKYGSYSLKIGPTEDGFYHEIVAQGISQMTASFPHYDLSQINKEVKKSGLLAKGTVILPKYIGGQAAGLLIGIKNTGIEPVLQFQLPCGLGIYKSPIMDKFGSRYCYGGPHEVFSVINKKLGDNFNHVHVYFTQMISQYKNSPYPMLSRCLEPQLINGEYGVMFLKNSKPKARLIDDGIDVYPTAVSEIDMQEMGICDSEPNEDWEECKCDHNVQVHLVDHGVYKAKVPVSKRKEYFDEDDQGFINDFRCEDCLQCKKCLLSDRSKMMSLQEKREQEIIEKSVYVDLEDNKVYVELPFMKPPVSALKKKHNGQDNNFKQALKIYQSQCRKPEAVKTAMKKVHQELVDKGFLKKITDLTLEQQQVLYTAGFCHFMPWSTAEKADSISTPYRMVVDASVTGLNDILAKGENNMTQINTLLLRNRCLLHIWSSDISKLYNQLHLKNSALPYGLFLFHHDLDPSIEPTIYVMVVAWYGVTSTGNQSGEGLERLVTILKDTFPLASSVIKDDRYVDDILSGDNDRQSMEDQITDTRAALAKGGFNLKFVVRSGEDPCQEASSDGKTLKILGYKWTTKEDILAPGFGEINFNKRKRGSKKPNPFPVVCPNDVLKILDSTKITRRMVIAKIAEIWDPSGLWEPFKLQLKLDNQVLNGLEWDSALDNDLQIHWKERFQQFLEIPYMTAERCVIPEDAINPDKVRLICISDAAEKAGGCAIYAGFERSNGLFSCRLLTARSKLMNQKIPRNELEGIKLMAETATNVKKALGNRVEEILYFTDSTIAMCWCHNISKKLRMFTLYRVADIRRNILGSSYSTEEVELPLFHIDGKLNIADLLTKNHPITPKDLSIGSAWQNGLPWMELPFDEMPITTYQNLTVSKDDEIVVDLECFPEQLVDTGNANSVHLLQSGVRNSTHCQGCKTGEILIPFQICYGMQDEFGHCNNCCCQIKFSSFALKAGKGSLALVDIIKHGWSKTIGILSKLFKTKAILSHKVHVFKGLNKFKTCLMCKALNETGGVEEEMEKIFVFYAKDYLFRFESNRLKSVLPKKKIDSLLEKDDILYYEGRLLEENPVTQSDLGFDVFFDNTEIKSLLPVVLADSDLFFAFVMHIHHNIRIHSGVETTLREVNKTMMVLNNPRRVIQRIRQHCPKCRIIAKRTLELRMLNHPSVRTHIAPPFYHCQIDTVFGFKGQSYKNARKTMKVYALVIVCLLTGATNILALEGLETQDVVQALERHSARHGVPAVLFVDNGTQLMALDNTVFNLRDCQSQVYDAHGTKIVVSQVQKDLGMKVITSNAKSHEERGRVEAKVKTLRTMLEKLSVKTNTVMTAIQWETMFAKISSMIDDIPMAKCNSSNVNDPGWEIITANRLKLGRNNNRSLEGWIDLSKGSGSTALLRKNQEIQKVWYQLMMDKIHHLIPRPAKWNKTDVISIGDICLFTYTENAAMGKDVWKLGRVDAIPSPNKVVIKFPGNTETNGTYNLKKITRCPRNISIISAAGEVDLNSRKFYEQLKN